MNVTKHELLQFFLQGPFCVQIVFLLKFTTRC